MVVSLLRPSPQVPMPSVRSAIMCFEASSVNIKSLRNQMETAMVDITWVFVLLLFQALNTTLWSISYPEVRALHSKEEVEENIDSALEIIIECRERWPGTLAAATLYSKLAKACLKSYNMRDSSHAPSSLSETSPSLTDANSPSPSEHSSATTGSMAASQEPFHSPPQFGYVFDQMPEQVQNFDYGGQMQHPPQPSFRSNSIFVNPASTQTDRRFSYFPPDFTQPQALPNAWNPMTTISSQPQDLISTLAPPTAHAEAQQNAFSDPSYFLQPSPYTFGSHIFGEQSYDTEMRNASLRNGSLSQQQQFELMQTLETDGLTEIDNFMNHSRYENSIKL